MTEGDGKMTATAKHSGSKYGRLLARVQPAVIRTKEEYRRLMREIDKLMARDLTPEEGKLFDLMVRLVQDYEDANVPQLNAAAPIDILKHLMEARGVAPKDLWSAFGSKGAASEVLNGKRSISKTQAKRLAEFFHVSAELFI
jgi:HTH-type transcriptional regulator/antitoxin HigA